MSSATASCFEGDAGQMALSQDVLARLLLRYGLGQGEQAAIRAFGRIINAGDLCGALFERLHLGASGSAGDGAVEPALRAFCRTLARIPEWDFTPDWPATLAAHWSECYLAGAVAEFPFIAIEALIALCQQHLVGERAMVYRLELDILNALVRLGWCLGGLLAEVAIEHEQACRLSAEDGDPVLGIPNRRRFVTLLAERLERIVAGRPLGLVIVQVEWGRSADVLALDERDRLRFALSEQMRAVLRPSDILCSLGDDEWGAILPDLYHPAQVSLAGHKLVDVCEVLRANSFPALRGSFHAGACWAPEHAGDPFRLEQAARAALVVAKAGGRPCDVYGGEVAVLAEGDANFEMEIAHALEAQQFQLYLQPQVALPSRRVVGAEALLRWRRADGQAVPPPEILRVVGRIGLTPVLSRWAIQQAAQLIARMTAAGCGLRVSVNVAAEDLNDSELPIFIRQTCDTWRVARSRLCVEITESGLVSGEGMSASNLAALREGGGRLALDDFGTGYSSMDYLRRLPVDELKIDKSFVERITGSDNDRAIVELMVRIAHTFGLEVVAEGVENAATEAVLNEMGCDCAQGYLYAPAMPVEDFIDWWKASESAAD